MQAAADAVRTVLNTLHHFGAPATVLVTGKPHVGTDNLVKILKRFRAHLIALGCDIRFSAKVARLTTSDGHVTGIVTEAGETISASKVCVLLLHLIVALVLARTCQGITRYAAFA